MRTGTNNRVQDTSITENEIADDEQLAQAEAILHTLRAALQDLLLEPGNLSVLASRAEAYRSEIDRLQAMVDAYIEDASK
jgi:hypothetical protein